MAVKSGGALERSARRIKTSTTSIPGTSGIWPSLLVKQIWPLPLNIHQFSWFFFAHLKFVSELMIIMIWIVEFRIHRWNTRCMFVYFQLTRCILESKTSLVPHCRQWDGRISEKKRIGWSIFMIKHSLVKVDDTPGFFVPRLSLSLRKGFLLQILYTGLIVPPWCKWGGVNADDDRGCMLLILHSMPRKAVISTSSLEVDSAKG